MARSIGPGGSLDVLSLAILEDLKYDKENNEDDKNYKPSKLKGKRYYGSKFFQSLPRDATARNPKAYDRPKHWLQCMCAAAICMLVLGILNILPIFLPTLKYSLQIGALEGTVISAATYAIVFVFCPLASVLIKCMGTRLTCIFGLLVLFGGLVLDALEIHLFAFYAAHLLLIAIGSSLAITAAASSVLRHFRKKLVFALLIISLAAPFGTVFFHGIYYFLALKSDMTYKWIILTMAIMVLVAVALTHPLPRSPKAPRHPNPFFTGPNPIEEAARGCVDSVANNPGVGSGDYDTLDIGDQYEDSDEEMEDTRPGEGSRKSCVCICVLDLSSLTDIPFLLWVIVSSCALVTIYVPYCILLWYVQATFNFSVEDSLYLMLWVCLGSAIGRVVVMMSKNFTFKFNQTVFQGGTIGTAALYIVLQGTATFGWFLVWCFFAGFCEGLIVGVIPRLTLQTIPRKYMAHCWGYIVFCNGVATIIGPYLLMSIKLKNDDIAVACVAIGIVQFCGAALALFLPNEYSMDSEEDSDEVKQPEAVS